jgi:hypothetical protein
MGTRHTVVWCRSAPVLGATDRAGVGTNGIATNGNNPHMAQPTGYSVAPITAPNSEGTADAITLWVVF